MDERIAAAWSRLPDYLGQHVLLSAAALLLGIVAMLIVRPNFQWAAREDLIAVTLDTLIRGMVAD